MKFLNLFFTFLLIIMLALGCGREKSSIVEPPKDNGDTPGNPPITD